MKRFSILFLLIFMSCNDTEFQAEITGNVLDPISQNPIEGVTIQITENGFKKGSAISDENGYFSISANVDGDYLQSLEPTFDNGKFPEYYWDDYVNSNYKNRTVSSSGNYNLYLVPRIPVEYIIKNENCLSNSDKIIVTKELLEDFTPYHNYHEEFTYTGCVDIEDSVSLISGNWHFNWTVIRGTDTSYFDEEILVVDGQDNMIEILY